MELTKAKKAEKAEKERRGMERLIKDLNIQPKRKVLVDHSIPWNAKPKPEKPVSFFKSYDRPGERSLKFRKGLKKAIREVKQ